MNVNNRLAAIRQGRGLAAADLAKRVGVSRQTIYAIESGSYIPNTSVALGLARELEVSVEDIFSLAAPPSSEAECLSATVVSQSPAAPGKPVRVSRIKEQWVAVPAECQPYFLPEADGLVVQPGKSRNKAKVRILGAHEALPKRLVIAGCDPAIGVLAHMTEKLSGVEVVLAPAPSRLAIEWLRDGKVHVAGSHLEDRHTGEFNLPLLRQRIPDEALTVVTFARWEEGFVVVPGNPLKIRRIEDLARPKVRLVNRQPGSGSRALVDRLLRDAAVPADSVTGYDDIAEGHLAAAYAVSVGAADCCVATQSAARAFGLDFVPLHSERFDLAVRREFLDLPAVRCLLDVLQRASLRRKLQSLCGYDISQTGRVLPQPD